MGKKILIVTEEWAGSGHYMAAVAIQQALQEGEQHYEVIVIGGLGEISPLLRSVSKTAYYGSLRYFPHIWRSLYDRERGMSKLLKKPLAKAMAKRLMQRVIHIHQPDVVIATHAYCLGALAEAKTLADKPFQLVAVLTDFHVNHFWLHPQIDYYVVPHGHIAEKVARLTAVPPENVCRFGIPLRLAFTKVIDHSKPTWRERLGLSRERFTVLVSGGGGGLGDISTVVKALLAFPRPLQIIVVTGNNRQLYERVLRLKESTDRGHELHLQGYVDAMWEWLGAADVIVSKAGGVTCSEAMATRTPIIFYHPLPGQEEKNSRFLCGQQVAVEASTPEDLVAIIDEWMDDTGMRLEVMQCMGKLSRADSAYRTADLIRRLASDRLQVQ